MSHLIADTTTTNTGDDDPLETLVSPANAHLSIVPAGKFSLVFQYTDTSSSLFKTYKYNCGPYKETQASIAAPPFTGIIKDKNKEELNKMMRSTKAKYLIFGNNYKLVKGEAASLYLVNFIVNVVNIVNGDVTGDVTKKRLATVSLLFVLRLVL